MSDDVLGNEIISSDIVGQAVTVVVQGVNIYADFCESLFTNLVNSLNKSSIVLNETIIIIMDAVGWLLSIPFTILTTIFKIVNFGLTIIFAPLWFAHALFLRFPIISTFFILSFILSWILFRQITKQSIIHYFLYTVVPYGVSIFYTVVGIFFPQLGIVSQLFKLLFHPINTLLDLIVKITRRAEPIRDTVRLFSPPRQKNQQLNSNEFRQEERNKLRIQCCVCIFAEKNVLIRPCNHVCLCESCLNVILRQSVPRCPVCRCEIKEHMSVFL